MKNLNEYLLEQLNESDAKLKELEKKLDKVEKKADDAEVKANDAEKRADDAEKEANKAEETIKDEKSFREAARAKFEEVFGDDLDEDKMNKTIDGLLKDHKDLVDNNEWGELIGMLNKSFGA